MKTLTFNKDSWHYAIATSWGKMSEYCDITDICYYTRRVLVGMVTMLGALMFMLLMAGFVLWMTGDTIAFWVVVATQGTSVFALWADDPVSAVGTMMLGGMAWMLLYTWAKKRVRLSWITNVHNLKPSKPDNALSQMYRSFKKKTCVKVELVSDKDETD